MEDSFMNVCGGQIFLADNQLEKDDRSWLLQQHSGG